MDRPEVLVLGPYRLDRRNAVLSRDGTPIALGRRAVDALAVLAGADGAVVSKAALMEAVWPGLTVEENNLQVQISTLRKALGDELIVTVPGRGYRLALPWAPPAPPRSTPSGTPSLVVLPFQNLSGDPAQDYFADGMVEDITTALSRIGGLFVIARNSAFTFKSGPVDVARVGHDLGVRYVVEGSVRRVGDRVRITAQLIAAEGAAHLWADRFDGGLDDVFDLQDRVTAAIAGAIEPNLRAAEIARARAKPTGNLDAYDLYLRAFHRYELFSDGDRTESIALCRRAIALDPDFARAKALLAMLLAFEISIYDLDGAASEIAECLAAARAALADAQDDPTTLRFAGLAAAYVGLDVAAGRAALDRALALNPNSASVRTYSGWIHLYAGAYQAAHDDFARAGALNPLDPELRWALLGRAIALIELDRGEESVEFVRRSYAISKGRRFSRFTEVAALAKAGRLAEARALAAALRESGISYSVEGLMLGMRPYRPDHVARRIALLRSAGLFESGEA